MAFLVFLIASLTSGFGIISAYQRRARKPQPLVIPASRKRILPLASIIKEVGTLETPYNSPKRLSGSEITAQLSSPRSFKCFSIFALSPD